jgi:hypothetical protein
VNTAIINLLRKVALIIVLAGAVASLCLVIYKSRNNNSLLLRALFVIWALLPFKALTIINIASKNWAATVRVALYILMLFLTVVSLIGYMGILSPPGTKPAFVFLFIPLLSWLLIGIAVPIAASRSKKILSRK